MQPKNDTIETLLSGLMAEDGETRDDACQALFHHDDDTLQTLIMHLIERIGNSGAYGYAYEALQCVKERSDPLVRSALKDPEPKRRLGGAKALLRNGELKPEALASLLTELLDDPNRDIRYTAAAGLGQHEPSVPKVLPVLLEDLKDTDKYAKSRALTQLHNIAKRFEGVGDTLLPHFVEALSNPYFGVRGEAIRALLTVKHLPADVLPKITARLEDDVRNIKEAAVHVLGTVGHQHPAAIDTLVLVLAGDDKELWYPASDALADHAESLQPHLATLVELLSGSEERRTLATLKLLKAMGPAASETAPALLKIIKTQEPAQHLWTYACQAITAMEERALDAVPRMLEGLQLPEVYEKGHFRDSLIESLGRIGEPAHKAIPSVISCLSKEHTSNVNSKIQMIKALAKLGPSDPDVLSTLIAALEDDNNSIRSAVLKTLDDIAGTQHLEALIHLLRGPLRYSACCRIKCAAIASVVRMGEEAVSRATPTLVRCLGSNCDDVRNSAEEVLRAHNVAIPSVQSSLFVDPDETTRLMAVKALAFGQNVDEKVLPALILLLSDTNTEVRTTACKAIAKTNAATESAILALIGCLADKERFVQFEAARSLAKLGPNSATLAVPALKQALKMAQSDDHCHVFTKALAKLQVSDEEVASQLRKAMRRGFVSADGMVYDDFSSRESAVKALSTSALPRDTLVPLFVEALVDRHAFVRQSAARALAQMGDAVDDEALDALRAQLRVETYNPAMLHIGIALVTLDPGAPKHREFVPYLWRKIREKRENQIDWHAQWWEGFADTVDNLSQFLETLTDAERADWMEALKEPAERMLEWLQRFREGTVPKPCRETLDRAIATAKVFL